MIHLLGKAVRPVVRVGAAVVEARRVEVHEPPGGTPTVRVETAAFAGTPAAEVPVEVRWGDDAVFEGTWAGTDEASGADGRVVVLSARHAAAGLDEPATCALRKRPRSGLLADLLGACGQSVDDAGAGDETHGRFVLLNEPRRPAAERLALLGGRLLLWTAEGPKAADPTQPGAPRPVVEHDYFRRHVGPVPTLRLVSLHPDEWGKVLRVAKPGGKAVHTFDLPAASAGELSAAARVVAAVEAMGRFELHGGSDLMNISPGAWVALPGREPLLVTGRVRLWTPSSGWSVRLIGGYRWDHLFGAPPREPEPAQVVGFDEETGLLKVQLPRHDDLVIDALLALNSASPDRLAAFGLTAAGHRGLVVFAGAAGHAVYVADVLPKGGLTKQQFEDLIGLLQTPDLTYELAKNGDYRLQARSVYVAVKQTVDWVKG